MTPDERPLSVIESPLREQHEAESVRDPVEIAALNEADRPGAATGQPEGRLELEYLPWGAGEGSEDSPSCWILATCGWVELEYAAMRRGCGLLDQPNRATISLRGEDRTDLVDRMVTQDLGGLESTRACRSFLTDRKGRLISDLLILSLPDEILLDVDVHQRHVVCEVLKDHVFTEDVSIEDATERWYRIGLHGPETATVLDGFGSFPGSELEVSMLDLVNSTMPVVRRDLAATSGCDLFVPRDKVVDAWQALQKQAGIRAVRARTVGWYAFNTARVEGGTPLFNIDFGTTNLPHETGLIDTCVSFTKGCYPGQEVVARMQHLGQPKQQLRGLRIMSDGLPVAGTQVFATEDAELAEPTGVVTSSTISPLAGATPLAFAMLNKRVVAEGTIVRLHAEGEVCQARVGGLDVLGSSESAS
ncbi:MAG: hypothetical protein VX527_00930 [Planctomycetota bacterium]|nr:hypothetical protein [Planctomycetota bacterium]